MRAKYDRGRRGVPRRPARRAASTYGTRSSDRFLPRESRKLEQASVRLKLFAYLLILILSILRSRTLSNTPFFCPQKGHYSPVLGTAQEKRNKAHTSEISTRLSVKERCAASTTPSSPCRPECTCRAPVPCSAAVRAGHRRIPPSAWRDWGGAYAVGILPGHRPHVIQHLAVALEMDEHGTVLRAYYCRTEKILSTATIPPPGLCLYGQLASSERNLMRTRRISSSV